MAGSVVRKVSRNSTEAEDMTGPYEAIETPEVGIVDKVPSGSDIKALFRDLAFLEEYVTIMLYPSMVEGDTTRLISVGVNGSKVYLLAGKPTKVRRKHVGQLVKARPDFITHRTDDPNEARPNVMGKVSTSRYNFDVVEDSMRGRMWLAELKKQYLQR